MPRPSRLVLPFGNSPAFESAMAEVGGESAKVLLASAWKTAPIRQAEVHWYEAHGIGRRDFKIKRFID